MSLWLWTFWTYSFLGYLLERGYAIATHADRQARKCFLLLPMCPVYGLGALAVLALPESLSGSFWSLALWGGLAATAVEYAVHVLYDRLLGVRFWDYSQVRWNLRGRVCLPFSLAWSLLVAAGLPVIQAAMLMGMEPASASTTPLFKKIPDPTIIPTTRDNASKKVKLFSGVLLFILRLPILLESP